VRFSDLPVTVKVYMQDFLKPIASRYHHLIEPVHVLPVRALRRAHLFVWFIIQVVHVLELAGLLSSTIIFAHAQGPRSYQPWKSRIPNLPGARSRLQEPMAAEVMVPPCWKCACPVWQAGNV